MAFDSLSGTVDNNRSFVDLPDAGTRIGANYLLMNSGAETIFCGGKDCTPGAPGTANAGFPLRAGFAIPINLNGADRLYFICSNGKSSTWNILKQDD